MDLHVDVSEAAGGARVVAVRGEVDIATAPGLRERLQAVVAEGAKRVVVDLEHVDFLDSTGLGVLIGAMRRLRSDGGDLVLVVTQSRIRKVFEITGLDKAFAIHAAVADALAE